MRNRLALLGVIIGAVAAGGASAAETNPWRFGVPNQAVPPQAMQLPPVVQKPKPFGGYNYAPLKSDPTDMAPPAARPQRLPMPMPRPVPGYGYGSPYGGYAQQGPGLGYPGMGYPGGGMGGSPYGWGNTGPGMGGFNGFNGPSSLFPFW